MIKWLKEFFKPTPPTQLYKVVAESTARIITHVRAENKEQARKKFFTGTYNFDILDADKAKILKIEEEI